MPKNKTIVSNENGLALLFAFAVEVPVELILEVLGFGVVFQESPYLKNLLYDPDRIICRLDTDSSPSLRTVIELKTPWAFPVTNPKFNLINAWIKEERDEGRSGKIYRAITQLYGYMAFNHLLFGVLSTYEWTFFFRRLPDRGRIEISPPVPRSKIVRYICAFYLLIENIGPFYSSRGGTPTLIEDVYILRKNRRNTLQLINTEHFLFSDNSVIGTTQFGNVILGKISGIPGTVVFKTKNICKQHGIADAMQHEADIYHHLGLLQDKIIPHFYGYVDFNGLFRALILKPCGRPIQPDEARSRLDEIRTCVQKIHRCGVLHGDLVRRNILIDDCQKIWITDFSHAVFAKRKTVHMKQLMRQELEALRNLGDISFD